MKRGLTRLKRRSAESIIIGSISHRGLLAPRGGEMRWRGERKPVRVAIGKTSACCERCGSGQFLRALANRRGEKARLLRCLACGAEHLYSALLSQIASTIIRHGDSALQDSERLRKRQNALGQGEQPAEYDLPHSDC